MKRNRNSALKAIPEIIRTTGWRAGAAEALRCSDMRQSIPMKVDCKGQAPYSLNPELYTGARGTGIGAFLSIIGIATDQGTQARIRSTFFSVLGAKTG